MRFAVKMSNVLKKVSEPTNCTLWDQEKFGNELGFEVAVSLEMNRFCLVRALGPLEMLIKQNVKTSI